MAATPAVVLQGATLFLAVLVSTASVAPGPSAADRAAAEIRALRITLTGAYRDIALRDPRGRWNRLTREGKVSTFPGCFRIDQPLMPTEAVDQDYCKFVVDRPVGGPYTLEFVSRQEAPVVCDVNVRWDGNARAVARSFKTPGKTRLRLEVVLKIPQGPADSSLSLQIGALSRRR